MLQYKWTISSAITQKLIEFEAIRLVFGDLPHRPNIEEHFRRHSLLKSSVFSARIEGFNDTMSSPKKESQNLLVAYHYIFSPKSPQRISISLIKKLHQFTLKNLSPRAGNWRTEPWAIFSQSGMAIYLAPPSTEVASLMSEYVKYINSLPDQPLIKAAVAQFIFEKIHPFADGNGRVGRLISAFILEKTGYSLKGLIPFEEYIDKHRESYYLYLEPSTNCTSFIEYFISAVINQSRDNLKNLTGKKEESPEDTLSLRRREILEVIRDHQNCSFDFLKRRFAAINPKTLHYDLAQLLKGGFIRKLGKTNGAVYTSK